MIRISVNIDNAHKEIDGLIDNINCFVDCRFDSPVFKKWEEDVHLFLTRTYDEKESEEKWSRFRGIQFCDAEYGDIIPSFGETTTENSGLGEAAAILLAWKEDLDKRRSGHTMNRIMKIIGVLIGVAGLFGIVAYFTVSINMPKQSIISNGPIGNVNMGDNAMQTAVQK